MAKIRSILGLAFEDNRILAAEVHIRGGKPSLHLCGEFTMDEELSAANLPDQGQRLRQFLVVALHVEFEIEPQTAWIPIG